MTTPRYRVQPAGDRFLVLDTGTGRVDGDTYSCTVVAGYVGAAEDAAHSHARRLNRHSRDTAAFRAAWHASRFERAKEAM